MSLLRRIADGRMPRVGETLKVLQHERVLAQGHVVCADHKTVSIAGKGIIDLDTEELRKGLHNGSIRIERNS